MNFATFILDANRTAPTDSNLFKDFAHASFGLKTEVGELVDILKRFYFYGKQPDVAHVKEEIGDVLWYTNLILFGIFPNVKEQESNMEQFTAFLKDVEEGYTDNPLFKEVMDINNPDSLPVAWGNIVLLYKILNGIDEAAGMLCDVTLSGSPEDLNTAELEAALDSIFRKLTTHLMTLIAGMDMWGRSFGLTLPEIMQANIDKLRTRFPEKFSVENALVRDLEAEDKVLGKA